MTPDASLIVPDWQAPAWVRAVSTTRVGGASQAPYSSLNLAQHVGDNPVDVAKNRKHVSELAGLPGEPCWLRQVHGNTVVDVGKAWQREADAAYTTESGYVCAVMTANCLPVLLCHKRYPVVAAVHAGWRGLTAGVIEAALERFAGTKPGGETSAAGANADILAWLGPAISARAFEVGEDVYRALVLDEHAAACFSPGRVGHWYADLYQLARLRLQQAGVEAIYGGDFCTFSDSQRFFSYRRDGVTGRMASLIWIAG